MQHVVSQPTPPFKSHSGALEVHQIPAWQDNLIWLITYGNKQAAVVDGPDADAVLEYCKVHGLTLTTILNTHTHGDHVGINRALAERGMLDGVQVIGPARAANDVPGLTRGVDDGDSVSLGEVTGQVWLTEGHIDGHVSYIFEDLLFCGDTLFAAGCGYLFDGPASKMYASLSRLRDLPPETRVCCAHEYTQDNLRFAWSVEPGNPSLAERIRTTWQERSAGRSVVPSTIALERATNPFMRYDQTEVTTAVQAAWPDRKLEQPTDVFAATRALKDRKDYRSLSDEDLPI
ncbi:MAG: hydroxyacylglutathione hydrolase [Polyangiaceae bacterium]|nr:hydroxyacylglutathione hydrolase [Myxococcales bacterium]MCB9588839.1 hydroxyacylglutathione hydrolase [Polyangiaceae bacterium]MCB9605398.1 hydroxyacylglutathione hydrolase [Polyangiaceae bacterium]